MTDERLDAINDGLKVELLRRERDQLLARLAEVEADANARWERYQREHERMRANERRVHDAIHRFDRPLGVATWEVAAGWVARADVAEARVAELETALEAYADMLARTRSGFPPETEAYYALRDHVRALLAPIESDQTKDEGDSQ